MTEPEFEVVGVYNCIKRSDFFTDAERTLFLDPQYLATQVIPKKPKDCIRFVCLSDTHTYENKIKVPAGDVVLHAGDFSYTGTIAEVKHFSQWFAALPHPHKIVIAGNHDLTFEKDFYVQAYSRWHYKNYQDPDVAKAILINTGVTYLEDQEVTIDGIRIYGSPWQPEFCNWAFNLNRGPQIMEKWKKIPDDGKKLHILITHGPSKFGGRVFPKNNNVGCADLTTVVDKLKPLVHLSGHIHEDYGVFGDGDVVYINGSNCTLKYKPINEPIVFDIRRKNTKKEELI